PARSRGQRHGRPARSLVPHAPTPTPVQRRLPLCHHFCYRGALQEPGSCPLRDPVRGKTGAPTVGPRLGPPPTEKSSTPASLALAPPCVHPLRPPAPPAATVPAAATRGARPARGRAPAPRLVGCPPRGPRARPPP